MSDFDFDPELLDMLTEVERRELEQLLAPKDEVDWLPQAGPQLAALTSEADIIGFGGAAGGGKSELMLGMALTRHERSLIIRREKAQTQGLVQRLAEILGGTDGYSQQNSAWRLGNKLLEFGGLDNEGDERRWQGRPHDFKAFDEATEMREGQVRFIMGWNRTNDPTLHAQTLMTFNPPTTVEGRWVVDYYAPWLEQGHPDAAVPGELRWFTTLAGKDIAALGPEPFVYVDDEMVFDFDPEDFRPEEIIVPRSRTFIPARVTDNAYYMSTGYMATLQAMPEPLRSLMLYGDFMAGLKDDPWQVIPTAWVKAAQARWTAQSPKPVMDSQGVDVARGGDDETIIINRHGTWFDMPIALAGKETPDGPAVAGQVIAARRNDAVVHIDVVGVGASPYDFLNSMNVQVVGVNAGETSTAFDKSGKLRFRNLRSELWWRMREALDPANNTGIALPPSSRLLADLCAPKWKTQGRMIVVESREEIIKKIGRSPDYGTAAILALMGTTKRRKILGLGRNGAVREHNPLDVFRGGR